MKNIRKTLNLIALTVFMGSNLLTPISYAVDDLENVGENLQSETSSESVGSTYDITGGGDSLTNLGDDEDLSDGADGSEEKEASELEDFVDDSGESDTQGFTQETQENADDAATKDAKTDTDNTVLDPSLNFHGEEAPTPSSPFPEGEEKGLEQNGKTQEIADDSADEKAKTDTDDTVLDYSFQTVGEEGDILTPSPSFELSGDNLEQSLTGEVENFSGDVLTGNVEETELDIAWKTLNENPIEKSEKYKKVTVNVKANEGTFPEGTNLTITPITQYNKLNQIKDQINESENNGSLSDDFDVVAFDIKFMYTLSDGSIVEVQPLSGESVQVTFDYSKNKELKEADIDEEKEIQVFHINDKDENGEKVEEGEEVVEKIEINEEKSDEVDNAVVIDAESFSIYTVAIWLVTDATNYTIYNQINNWYADDLELYFLQSDGTTVKHFTIMDRNLGATEVYNQQFVQDATKINTNSFGYHYQRGNNYGFEPCINNPLTNNSCTDFTNNNGFVTTIAQNIWSAYMPSKYARNTWSTSSNWMANSTTSDNIWGGGGDTTSSNADGTLIGNSNNDWSVLSGRQGPCPDNYYIPSTYDWLTLKNAWGGSVSNSNNGTQFASDLLLPPAGYRNYNKTVYYQGYYGRYWSSSPYPSDANIAHNLYFNSSNISPQYCTNRSHGYSVRCAKSSPNTPTFTLHANGGTKAVVAFTGTVGDGKFTTLGTPTRSNSTFSGWYTASEGGEKLGVGSGVVSDIYARWSCSNGYVDNGTTCVAGVTVTLNATANGGTITPTSVTVANGAQFPLENYIASKDGYTFEGWAETSGTTGVLTSNPTITANKTLYAVFSKTLTGTFNKGDSTVSSISDTKATCTLRNTASNCILTAPTITCEAGYSNGVWDPSSMTISANTTFTASCSDAEKPVCSVTTQPTRTSMSLVNGYNQGTVTFTCTDNVGVSTTNLSASNINYDSNVVTLSNSTAGGTSTSKTFTFTYTANAQGSTTFALKAGAVSDAAGNSNVVTDASNTVTVDTTAPTITITQPNSSDWTKSKSVTASASDGTLTMKESTSSTCNSSVHDFVTYADKNYISESDNGKYICYKAVDSVGNEAYESSAKVEKIDRTAPVLSGQTTFLSTWYTTPQTSTFTYSDTGAGINEGYNTASCIISTEGIDSTCQVTPNICDKVGNCNTTTQTSNSIKLDKTAPVFTGKTQFSTDWYNTNQTSYFTYEDTVSGINGDSTTSCVINEEGTTATCTVENTNICNNAGLCNTINQTSNSIKLDKTNPTCSITGNPTSPTNQNVELTLNYLVEANQIDDGYSWNGESYSTTQTFTVTQNGTYTGYVKDAAGNTGSCSVEVTMIDKVLPDITINNPDTTPAQSKTITATTDKGTLYMAITGTNVCNDSLDFVAYESITFSSESDNGKYVCYKAEDEAGNVKYGISAQISGIDTTAPVIGFANDVKKGPSQSDLVEVNWGDATVKKWRYSDTSGCSNIETLYDKIDSDSMNQATQANNGKYICLFASDTAGNIATKASANPINIDITNPTCNISGNPTEWRNQPATLTVEMVDANVDENGYSWDDDQHYGNTTTKEISNNGTYVAYVRDLAGNTGTCNVEVTKFDNTKPLASVTSTNNLKSTSQTATLSCGDGVGVTKYYRGNKSNPTDGDYTAISSTTEFNKDETVTSAGTYYLFCKDDAGNVSDSVSQTYYSYEVHNMLNAIDKAEGAYDATNYPQASTYTYIAPAGTTITFANVYTVPQYSSGTQYLGYTTSDNGNPSDGVNVSLDDNSTYYFWFNRAKHGLILQINTGIEKIYYKVNSGSEYSSVSSMTVVSMKEGSNAYVYATASNGYELTDAFKDYNADSPKTWNNITSQQTFLPNASIITYSIDYELDGGELETGKTNPEEYTVETPNFVLNNPIKDGYTFAGWTGTSLSDATETVTVTRGSFGDREYTATYNINNYNYRVEYYYDGDLSGAVTETVSATFHDVINSYTGKNIDGYKLDHEIGLPLTITSTVENNVIKVYYVKDNFDYSIEYYYDNVKDDAKTVTGKAEFASQITTYPDKLIAGYVLSGTVGLPLTITSNPVNNLIKVYYKKSSDLSYTIKYKDTENNTLSGDVVVPNQTFGDEIIVTPGAIEGYVTPSAKNVTITADSSANVVTFIYNKRTDLTYTIKYQNSVGTSISGDVVVENQTFGAEVTVIPGAIEGYNTPASTGFIIGVTNPDVVFVYTERNDLTYTIRYVDTNNNELSGHVVVENQTFGDNVVVDAPEIPGYNTPASTGFTIKVVNPDVVFIYAPKTDIEYTVTYKDKYGSGLLADKTVNTGVMNTDVTENAPSIDGYEVQTGSFTIRLKATNNHINFVYNPKEYAIRFVDGSGNYDPVVRSGEYVSTIVNKDYPDWSKDGYTIHWDKAIPDTMPLNGIEITASWTPNTNTAYKIEHYKEKLDGTYEKDLTENKTGTTDTTATATPKTDYEGFTYSGDVEGTKISGNIEGSGGLVLKLYYTRNSYNVSYAFTGDIPSGQSIPGGDAYKYQETVPAAPVKSADGYDFLWSEANSFSMPANDVVITGTWTAHTNTQYLVYHQKEKLDGTYETVSVITGHGATDTKVTPVVNTYSGFNSPEAQEITIGGDGNTVLTYQYSRKVITLTLVNDNGTPNTIITGKYESNVQKPAMNPSKTGYTFTTWSPSIPNTFPAISGTYTAQYSLDTYTITYHMNSGTNHADNPESYTYLSGAITLKEPTRDDYVFSGWQGTSIDGISKTVVIPTHSTGSRTYTAIWAEDKNHDGQDDATEPKYTVTINYVYTGGRGEAEPSYTTGNQLSGFTYNVNSPSIQYYHADRTNVSGTVTGNVVETVTYTPDTDTNGNGIADEQETKYKVTVNYVYSRGGTATGSVSGMYLSGIVFNFVSPTIPNYTANSGTVSGTGTEENQTFTVIYTPIHDENGDGYADEEETKYTVTINYVYSRGGTATGSYITGNQLSGFTYNVDSPSITYYHADKTNVSGTVTGNVVETVTYTPNNDENNDGYADELQDHYMLTIHYVNSKGTKVFNDYTGNYVSGANYSITSTLKTYYTIQAGGEVISGVMGTGNIEKTVVYVANHDTNDNGVADEEEDITPTPAPSGGSSSGGGGRRINPSDNDRQIHGSAEDEQEIGDNSDKEDQNKGTDDKKDSNNESYTEELTNAYNWAKTQGITTMPTIERAKLYDGITREQLAKMMVVYVSKVLGKQPIKTDIPKYRDVNEKNRGKEMSNYIQLAYQYQIMGIDYKGNPIRYFNPEGRVTRAEFATVFSRVLYGSKYNQNGKKYYEKHIQALQNAGILTNNNPEVIELRGWIMLMLYRSLSKVGEVK